MFVVVPIKFIIGVRHALIAPQSYDVRVHVYTYSKQAFNTMISITNLISTCKLDVIKGHHH